MRADIISAMSVLEAVIDFGEDEGIGNDDIEPGACKPSDSSMCRLRISFARQYSTPTHSTSSSLDHTAPC